GSSPLPTPLLPFVDAAMAGDVMVVDSRRVIVGGTTMANLPAVARKARRSAPALVEVSSLISIVMPPSLVIKRCCRRRLWRVADDGPGPACQDSLFAAAA